MAQTARSAGALGASQNMVGHAVHAIVWEREVERVVQALRSDELSPQVDVYDFATGPALTVQ